MLFIAEMFTYSKMPDFIVRIFVNKSKRTWKRNKSIELIIIN